MRLLASYTQCTVIGVDYSLSPEARFPQAIEETIAACQFFYQQADDYQLNMTHIGFAGDSAGAMLSLASALWLRDKHIFCGKVAGVLLWYRDASGAPTALRIQNVSRHAARLSALLTHDEICR